MRFRTIDLSKMSMTQVNRTIKRLKKKAKKYPKATILRFILPYKPKAIKRDVFEPGKIRIKCPYCTSKLEQTDEGIICTSNKMKEIIFDIEQTLKRHKDNPDMYMSTKASRFYDSYKYEGKAVKCDYVQGNEERRFKVSARILVKGVEKDTIKKRKV